MTKSTEIYKSNKKLQNGINLNITATVIFKNEDERSEEEKQAIRELREALFDFEYEVAKTPI